MNRVRSTLLLMLLTLVALTTNACSAIPVEPHDSLWQPIVEQKFCTDPQDENTCEVKSFCRQYDWDTSKKLYTLAKTWELKKCSGTFGQDIDSYNRMKDFLRQVQVWVKRNCGAE